MNVVRVKAGVKFDRLAPAGVRILSAADQVARECGVDLEITCGTEGHAADDPHTLGEAFDFSVRNFDVDHILDVRERLMRGLGQLFTVLYERPDHPTDKRLAVIAYVNSKASAPHLHVQRKTGTLYPPQIVAANPTTV